MDLNSIILSFFIYSFLGWCVEVTYQYHKHKVFINRGFLRGPFCPIYGFCILILITLFANTKESILGVFIIATAWTSIIEYITSYLLEKCFKLKWWDYSEDPLNIQGRISFPFSIAWGLASVLVIYLLNPLVVSWISLLNGNFLNLSAFLIILYFSVDVAITLYKLVMTKKQSLFKRNYKFKFKLYK